jgi:hypothetical protein
VAASCSAAAQAGIGKDYTTHGYEFGAWSSRFDLFDAGLNRIEARFGQLIPPPVRKIPIFIGGGLKRTLPAVAHHADIWHSVLSVDAFTEASARVDELAAAPDATEELVRCRKRRRLPAGRCHHVHHH